MKNKTRILTDYSKAPFTNDYMFVYVLSKNPDIAKELVEVILGQEVERVVVIDAQKVLNYSTDAKYVRLDVYLKDGDGTKYDVEMQTSNKNDLARRMRYYQSVIDADDGLIPGENYKQLSDSYVIFICTYDALGKGDARYTFNTRCNEYPEIAYDDGSYKIVLNAQGKSDSISPKLRELLEYVASGNVTGEFTKRIQSKVDDIRNNESWRKWAMTLEQKQIEARQEGYLEGKQDKAIEVALNLLSTHSNEEIARICNITVEEVQQLREQKV